jgi:hypothetical protein
MANFFIKFPITKKQSSNKFQIPKTNNQILLISLVIVSCILVISPFGCGDLEGEIASLTISPTSATIGVSKTQLFTVRGEDEYGFIVDVDAIWSVSGNIGNVTSIGFFTAGSVEGTGYVTADYAGKTAIANVTVTEKGWLTGRIQSSLREFGYIQGITVFLEEDPDLSGISDSDGRYSISDITAGSYTAQTEPTVDFKAASTEVTIERGDTTTWNVFLETQSGVGTVPTTTFPTF